MEAKQLSMFDQGQDLPLFSGTAQRADFETFQPERQDSVQYCFAACKVCRDTGVVDGRACWCDAGLRAMITVDKVKESWSGTVAVYDNNWHDRHDDYGTWTKVLEAGRSYLVGSSVPMGEFLKHHRSNLTPWQKLAYAWARLHPESKLVLRKKGYEWEVYQRGEYIEFGLPHHDAGGERHYVSIDGKSKILVNVD